MATGVRRDRPRTGSLLVTGIGELVTCDPARAGDGDDGVLGLLHDAAVVLDEGRVAWVGPMDDAPATDDVLDVEGRAVLPGFVDSHAHLVFAGDRAEEFAARMAGQRYAAGGIRTTVAATRAATREELDRRARRLARELLRQGATTIEVKTGYGLSVEAEATSAQVAAGLTEEVTFLGAHVVGPEFAPVDGPADVAGYVELVTGPMLDAVADAAKWIDVFVEDGAFGEDEARTILRAGQAAGLGARVHANQLGHGPGVRVACEVGAASADHCTHLTDDDVRDLADAGVVATLLPGAEFSTRSPYPDARRLLDAGVTVALATDCNPGTSYTTSMPLMVALGVRECGLTPAEAVWAATGGGAAALRREDVGRVAVGARGDLVVLDAPTHVHLAYRPGVPLVDAVVRGGRVVIEGAQR